MGGEQGAPQRSCAECYNNKVGDEDGALRRGGGFSAVCKLNRTPPNPIPAQGYPSDHLLISALFEFRSHQKQPDVEERRGSFAMTKARFLTFFQFYLKPQKTIVFEQEQLQKAEKELSSG